MTNRSPAEAADAAVYERRLQTLLSQHHAADSLENLTEAVYHSKGASPTELVGALRSQRGVQLSLPLDYVLIDRDLPTAGGHPADFEWYFTESSVEYLSQLAALNARRILLLGTPSLFSTLTRLGCAVTLVDSSTHGLKNIDPEYLASVTSSVHESETRFLKQNIQDLYRTNPELGSFDAVVIDPPWYREHYTLWIALAARNIREGGSIYLALMPPLTRPSASQERDHIKQILRGFGRVSVVRDRLRYRTPTFEYESLRGQGVEVTGAWRTGDLVCVSGVDVLAAGSLIRYVDSEIDTLEAAFPESWTEYELSGQYVKVRGARASSSITDRGGPLTGEQLFAALPGSHGFVLPTVSRRYWTSNRIPDIWTSTNRAAYFKGRLADLHSLVLALRDSRISGRAYDDHHPLNQLRRLLT